MTFAALQRHSDATTAAPRRRAAGALRVGDALDSFEQEADRVADQVAAGGHVGGWSLSKLDWGKVQRDPTPDPAPSPAPQPKPDNYDEALAKLGEAFLQTDLGKQISAAAKADTLVKGAQGFVDTLPGKIIAGAAAAGVVSALAATHTPLPAQIPAIPLDMLKPGLTVKITWEGPVDHPAKAMITFGYTPKSADDGKKKPQTRAERQREQNAATAADQEKFREGLKSPQQRREEAADEREALGAWMRHAYPGIGGRGAGASGLSEAPLAGPQLQLPHYQSPLRPAHASLLDKKLELPTTAAGDAKKEEPPTPVQRKAGRALPLIDDSARSLPLIDEAAPVREVLGRGGRPLDPHTRRSMEARFGYDFSKVRVHTDATAALSARALGAHAYTVGSDVVFAAGRFAPDTVAGRRLLAHELTHVVQQSRDLQSRPVGIRPAPARIQRDADDDNDSGGWFSDPVAKIKKFVRKLPGYKLFSVIIEKDPLTGEHIDRNAANLLGGLFALIPGGEAIFERIQKSGALEGAFKWVTDEIERLGLHWAYFKGLIDQALDSLGWRDLTNIQAAKDRLIGIFQPAYEKVKQFAADAGNKVLEIAMEAALALVGGTGILDTLREAGQAFRTIVKDPVGFLKNLIEGLNQGFTRFKDHILEHLKNTVLELIFGAVLPPGVTLPKNISLGSVVGLVLQILGLTWENFRGKLVARLGEPAVNFLEGTFDFLMKIVRAKSLAVVWELILQKADQLMDTVLEGVKSWVVTKVVTIAVVKLATLFNPVGAIVEAIQAIYKTINFFIEKAKQLKALVDAIVKSLANIAAGRLTEAANFVENAMARALSAIVGFLADYFGLGDIGKKVREIIGGVRKKVDDALDKILDWVVEKGAAFYQKGKEAAGKVFDWWQQRKEVLVGEEEHSIYMEGTENAPKLMIASVPGRPWSEYLKDKKVPAAQKPLLTATRKLAEELEKPLPPSSNDKEKAANVEKKRKLFNEIAANIVALGFSGEDSAPASVIEYGGVRAEDGGGLEAKATILSRKHPPGTPPSDEPPIWMNLGSLIQKKNYVQGHLLNHNLGGEGRRFNLSPINKKANAEHLSKIERTVKKTVNQDKKVMSYQVKAIYGVHSEKPKRYLKLKDLEAAGELSPRQRTEFSEYEAEQKLCTGFEYRAAELSFAGNKWAEAAGGVVYDGKIENTLEG
jgi:hypothetical protein